MQIDDVSRAICMFKAIVTMFFYSNVFFPYQMCTILVKIKIEGDLNNDDYKNKST
jgi:hypothetical protein